MGKLLRVLIIEDSEDDVLLVLRQLRKGGYDPEYERVETAEPMEKALREKSWDVVLCDYKLPHFSGFEALALFNKSGLDIPFIIVSGTIGEETAVAAMRAGARDYVMKDKLSRIAPAIARELEEAESRRLRRIYEHELFRSEANLTAIMNSSNDWIWSVDTDNFGLLIFNRAMEEYFMHNAGICIQKGMTPEDLLPPERVAKWRNFYRRAVMEGSYEMEYETVQGTSVFLMSFNPVIHDGRISAISVLGKDITDRKLAEERYRSIFENAQEGIFRSTPEGKIFMANAAMARIFGYESPDELTAAVTDAARQIYVNSEERTKIIQIIEENGFIKNHETQLYRKDGSIFWVSMTMRAVRDAG